MIWFLSVILLDGKSAFLLERKGFSLFTNLVALESLKDDTTFKKMNPMCAMVEEFMILLNPLWYRYPRLSLITFTTLDPNRILEQMEESFAEEISAFYYMNLLKPNIDVDEMKIGHDSLGTESSSKGKELKIDFTSGDQRGSST